MKVVDEEYAAAMLVRALEPRMEHAIHREWFARACADLQTCTDLIVAPRGHVCDAITRRGSGAEP